MINNVVKTRCPMCGQVHYVEVDIADYYAWADGYKKAQEAFPYLNAHEREMLISGICHTCWDKLYPPEEDDCINPNGDCWRCPNPCI